MEKKYKFDEKEHLHFLNDKPLTGTSSVGNVLSKPLTWWAAELAAVECLETGEKIETIREEYQQAVDSGNKREAIKALQEKYPLFKRARYAHFATLKDKAKSGTDLHEILEHFVKAEMGKHEHKEYPEQIQPFIEWSGENIKQYVASEAHCYSEKLWVGGITDAVAELKDGSYAIIDFKSSKEAYANQFIQACLYAIQIDENGMWAKDGKVSKKLPRKIDKLMIVPFGASKIIPKIRNAKDYKEGAECAVKLYRLVNRFESNN